MATNSSDGCSAEIPFSEDYLPRISQCAAEVMPGHNELHLLNARGVGIAYQIVFGFAGAAVLAILAIYVEEMVFFFRRLYNWKPKDKAKWILGIYPILSVTAFVTLLIPRAAALRELVSSIFLSFCVYIFVTMMVGHYGGARKMMTRLQNTQIPLATLPFCCCCVCLPRPPLTSQRLFVLETLVFQYAVIRPVLGYIQASLYADGKFGQETVGTILTICFGVVTLTSTLTAMWCFNILFVIARPYLLHMAIRPKHLCMTIVVFISSIQPVIINIFVVSGVMPCSGLLNPKSHGDRWHNMLVVFEMLVLSLIARRYYRRVSNYVPNDDLIDQDRRVDDGTLYRIDMSFSCLAVPPSVPLSTNRPPTITSDDTTSSLSSTQPNGDKTRPSSDFIVNLEEVNHINRDSYYETAKSTNLPFDGHNHDSQS